MIREKCQRRKREKKYIFHKHNHSEETETKAQMNECERIYTPTNKRAT
jgi:hypothetical protein